MPQLLLQGFPDGAIRIGPILSVLKKDGRVTYFVGGDNYYSHAETDAAGQRCAIATLIAHRHVRASEVEASCLGMAHRTLMHGARQLDKQGPGSFFCAGPRARWRGDDVGISCRMRTAARCGPRTWMDADPEEAGYLYVDGHVRVYHGANTRLPRRDVSRERLCLRGTTDYWINDALGRPFFVVSKAVTDGLATTLLDEIVPDLLASVPSQPSEADLAADPLLHRFAVIFDREGSSHSVLSKLWAQRIGAITYRKAVKDLWPASEFSEIEVPVPGGGAARLTHTGHQTAIITTARRLNNPVVAGRMFSRWCQEDYFKYMMQHYDIDGLVPFGDDELPGTLQVVNPAWRTLDKAVADSLRRLRKQHADLSAATLRHDGGAIQIQADRLEHIQQLDVDIAALRLTRCNTPKKVTIASLPQDQRPRQLAPLGKMLTDTVKMIAYRAETALVGLVRPHLAREEDARALVRELFVSSADLEPHEQEHTLTIRIHRTACPAHDTAISALLADLTHAAFCHPETGMRLIYALA